MAKIIEQSTRAEPVERSNRVYARAMALGRGLYSLRYIGADDTRSPPRVTIHVAPDPAGQVVITYGPDSVDGVLRKLGDLATISSTANASIVLTIFVDALTIGDGVNLKLDQLDRVADVDGATSADQATAPKDQSTADLLPVMLAGHIERRGDVSAAQAGWLGTPNSRTRLEGFSILWPHRPLGVDILYSCNVGEMGPMPETLTGGFCGTRSRALPIYSVDFKLVGENAEQYELEVEAAFLDGSVVGPVKAPAEIKASTERSPLVGLRLAAREVKNNSEEAAPPPAAKNSRLGIKASDLRVYRSIRNSARREKSLVV